MTELPSSRVLSGRPLRHVCTIVLAESGPRTVSRLVDAVERDGFAVEGLPSKTISDALRWAIDHGRVIRLGRAIYGPGTMPRQTRARIVQRVESLRADACKFGES